MAHTKRRSVTSTVRRMAARALLPGIVGALVSAGIAVAAPDPPSADPFYTPPAGLSSYAPGAILRSRQLSVLGPTQLTSATAYELLYRTTDANGDPAATVTTLLVPQAPAAGPRRLVSYQTAEDSLTTNCAPSYTLRGGNNGGETNGLESTYIALLLGHGWDVVVPDYEGPRSEWAVGPLEGRMTLDSIRAVEQFAPAGLQGTGTAVGMMGYSGGSIPTDWANALASGYAPELNLVAAAAGGNVPDPIENISPANGGPFFGAMIGVLVGIDRAYPELDLNGLLNASGQQLAAQDGADASGCAGSVDNAPLGTVAQYTNYSTPQALEAVPRVQEVFAKLDLIGGPVPAGPSFIYNEINDELAIIAPVDKLVASDCARGAVVDYDRDPVGDHLTGGATYGAPAIDYIQDRFAGQPAPDTCAAGSGSP